jgi:hypothetical protein
MYLNSIWIVGDSWAQLGMVQMTTPHFWSHFWCGIATVASRYFKGILLDHNTGLLCSHQIVGIFSIFHEYIFEHNIVQGLRFYFRLKSCTDLSTWGKALNRFTAE